MPERSKLIDNYPSTDRYLIDWSADVTTGHQELELRVQLVAGDASVALETPVMATKPSSWVAWR